MNTFHTDVSVSTGNLFKLERCGKYEEALAEIPHVWEDIDSFPDVANFLPAKGAEILLRCGALIGFLGHNKQITDSQEKSKNLLTQARNIFFQTGNLEKIVECENYLALAYWRSGELVEAETWVGEALSHEINRKSDAWIYANVTKALIYLSLSRYNEVEQNLKLLEKHFQTYGSYFLNGSFCVNLAVALKNLGKTSEAVKYLEFARFFHQKSRHRVYLGTVENNLAALYKNERRYEDAHKAIDSAVEIFKKVKDLTREGFALDTKAQVFCAESRYDEALKVIERAIILMNRCENAAYVVETYLSKSKILLCLQNSTAAFLCLSDAVQIAKNKISEDRAAALVKDFEAFYKEKSAPVISRTFSETIGSEEGSLELVLPPTIAHYGDFQGVWINNTHLESFGLRKGSLAVVGKTELKRGDLVAINEIATNSVMCGFYDTDFGLVCLEGIDDEPRFFDENEIEVLGKIIGVGKADKSLSGKIEIEPLNI